MPFRGDRFNQQIFSLLEMRLLLMAQFEAIALYEIVTSAVSRLHHDEIREVFDTDAGLFQKTLCRSAANSAP